MEQKRNKLTDLTPSNHQTMDTESCEAHKRSDESLEDRGRAGGSDADDLGGTASHGVYAQDVVTHVHFGMVPQYGNASIDNELIIFSIEIIIPFE